MQQNKSISVILPNYNGKHLMEKFIPSVYEALTFCNADFEFIVVDDCSTDNSVTFLKHTYPQIKLIVNTKNSGFSFTCNQGIKQASKDLVFLLNSDVALTPEYFQAQFKYFNADDTFGVMGRIMNFDGKKIEDAARFPLFKGSKFKANKFYYIANTKDYTFTTYLSGANALINRKKLQFIDGFDEIYSPFYFEDFDLGLRAWKMGWKLYYEHESICFHQVSSSTNKLNKSNFVKITYHRNSFILQRIHLEADKCFFWLLQLYTITLIGHLLKGEFWIIKSLQLFWSKNKDIKNSRQKIKQLQQQLHVKTTLKDMIRQIKKSLIGKKVNWL